MRKKHKAPDIPESFWRDIPGYPGYQASRTGEIRRIATDMIDALVLIQRTKLLPSGCPYKEVSLNINGTQARRSAAKLVALAWLGEPPAGKPFATHKNRVSTDNNITNLRWSSRAEANREYPGKSRPVAKIDENGNILEVYPTLSAAAKANYRSRAGICAHCQKPLKAGLVKEFAYLEEIEQ